MNLKDRSFIHKAFDITRENLILAQPLIIFMIVLSFTLAGLSTQTQKIPYLIFLTANILLTCAFIAGWFFMIKQGIYLNKRIENGEFSKREQRAEASFALGKSFFIGVGESFICVTITTLLNALIYAVVLYGAYKIGLKLLPHPHIDWHSLQALSNASTAEIQKYILSLSTDQIVAANLWMSYIFGIFGTISFCTMFLFPAVIDLDPKENVFVAPFKALWLNLKFLFKNFLGSAGIMIYIFILNMILSVLSIIFNLNIVLAVIGMIISFYFMTYAVTLIFLYYEDRK